MGIFSCRNTSSNWNQEEESMGKDTTTNLMNASGFTATECKGKFWVPSTEIGE